MLSTEKAVVEETMSFAADMTNFISPELKKLHLTGEIITGRPENNRDEFIIVHQSGLESLKYTLSTGMMQKAESIIWIAFTTGLIGLDTCVKFAWNHKGRRVLTNKYHDEPMYFSDAYELWSALANFANNNIANRDFIAQYSSNADNDAVAEAAEIMQGVTNGMKDYFATMQPN